MTISSLVVELKLMADSFNSQMRTAQKEAKELEKVMRPTTQAITDMGTAMAAVGAAVVGGLVAMTKEAADYGDALRDASIRTGVATQQLAGLKIAAEQSGTSFDEVQAGLKKFAVNVNAAAEGSKKQADLFNQLGISVTDASGHIKPMNDLLKEAADKFKDMPDGIQKTAMMVELFGKNGAQLNEFLSLGSKGLDEFQQKAEKLGLAIGTDAAAAADKFNDTLNDLKAATLGLSLAVGNALLPYLTELAVRVENVIVSFRQFVEKHRDLIEVALKLGAIIGTGGALFLGLAGLLTLLPKITVAWEALNLVMAANPVGFVIVAITTLITVLVAFRNEIAGGLAKAYAFLLNGLASIVDAASRAAHALGLNGLGNALNTAGNAIRAFGNNLADMGKQLLAGTPVVIDNTAAIERYKQTHQQLPPIIRQTTDELDKQKKALADLKEYWDKALEDFRIRTGAGGETVKEGVAEGERLAKVIIEAYHELLKLEQEAGDNLIKHAEYWDKQLQIFRDGAQSVKDDVKAGEEAAKMAADKIIKQHKDMIEQIEREQKQAVEDVKQSAGKVFDDMFVRGQSVFASLKNLLKGGALSLGRAIFEDVAGALLGPIKKAFDDFFKSLLNSIGLKTFVEGLGTKIGGALSGMIGGGTSAAASAGSTAASAGSTASGAASGAASGISGALGSTITGGISAAVGVLQIFQQKRLEGTMNAVEYNTRAGMIHLYFILTDLLPSIRDELRTSKDMLVEIAQGVGAKSAFANGGSGLGGSTYNFSIQNVNVEVSGDSFDDTMAIRQKLLPKIVEAAKLNSGGFGTQMHEAIG